ncbi:RHS repeat domain-containing protein, partial [Stenotrophomonas maltophilia group sp. RNC7]|uniref:RHS repeat domain-containing protein n=1 Tax=Stenotrophomonas maltophilia group sp. RNC7 TaxID=3071467 RepID=UPI0027E02312
NQMVNYQNPEGHSIEYQYDSNNRITKIISPLRDGSITNIYDDKDRVIEQILANGSTMYFEYDEANQRTILTERDGSQTIYYYDDLYRITDVIYEDGMTRATFNDKNERTSFT